MTLAIGFLVDDAVVFLENVVRRAEAGESVYLQATINSAGEISFTILSMTLSLAAVFIPLVFLPGLLGRIFREFSITIIVAIFRLRAGVADGHAADVRARAHRTRPRQQENVDRAQSGRLPDVGGRPGTARSLDWFLERQLADGHHLRNGCLVGIYLFLEVAIPFSLAARR